MTDSDIQRMRENYERLNSLERDCLHEIERLRARIAELEEECRHLRNDSSVANWAGG